MLYESKYYCFTCYAHYTHSCKEGNECRDYVAINQEYFDSLVCSHKITERWREELIRCFSQFYKPIENRWEILDL